MLTHCIYKTSKRNLTDLVVTLYNRMIYTEKIDKPS
jgi:hypothetical protein